MKVLIFGHGHLASLLREYFSEAVVSQCDVRSLKEVGTEIKKYKPEICFNTASKTSLEWCEENELEAFNINALGAYNIYKACRERATFLCHFSTGCLFQSSPSKPVYAEDDKPNPKSFYSHTKVWAEDLLENKDKVLILRPRLFISSAIDTRNLLVKWLTFSHFITDLDSRTIVDDLLPILYEMVKRKVVGRYHIVNEGSASSFECAEILKEKIDPQMQINKTTLAEVNKNLAAVRVSVILSTQKLNRLGYRLPPFKESFPKVVENFKRKLDKAGGLLVLEEARRETVKRYLAKSFNPSTFDFS